VRESGTCKRSLRRFAALCITDSDVSHVLINPSAETIKLRSNKSVQSAWSPHISPDRVLVWFSQAGPTSWAQRRVFATVGRDLYRGEVGASFDC
jgi:hypothetical protein